MTILMTVVALHGLAGAESGGGAEGAGRGAMTLAEAVGRALEQNLGLQRGRNDPEIAAEGVTAAEAAFDLEVFGNAGWDNRNQASTSSLTEGTSSSGRDLRGGVRKSFGLGTEATVSTSLGRNENNAATTISDVNYDSVWGVEVRQPLLQGAGTEVNRAGIESARSGLAEARLRLGQSVMDVLQATETAYWNLAAAYARRELRQSSLQLSERLLAETREKERVGLATKVELLQAEANRAQRAEEILLADQAIADAADVLVGLLGALSWAQSPLADFPRVENLPEEALALPPFEKVWTAVESRDLDLAIQAEIIRQREWDRVVAKDRVDPQLDVAVEAGLLGRDETSGGGAVESALQGEGDFWGASLQFSMPWGSRGEKARWRQTELAVGREEARLAEIRQGLLESARRRWRALSVSRDRLGAAWSTLELQEAVYAQAAGRYAAGLISFREVLEAERDLDTARLSLLDARTDMIRAAVALSRLDGSILDRHGLRLEELVHTPREPGGK